MGICEHVQLQLSRLQIFNGISVHRAWFWSGCGFMWRCDACLELSTTGRLIEASKCIQGFAPGRFLF